jgi:hypothetical protein
MADDLEDDWYKPNRARTPTRLPVPGELLFDFRVPRTHTLWRVELRDHGKWGVETQFLDPVEIRIAHTFRQEMDPTRTPRQMAIAWAVELLKEKARCSMCGDGCGWICETHSNRPWPHDVNGERCGGPGTRCTNPDCSWWEGSQPLALRRDAWDSSG